MNVKLKLIDMLLNFLGRNSNQCLLKHTRASPPAHYARIHAALSIHLSPKSISHAKAGRSNTHLKLGVRSCRLQRRAESPGCLLTSEWVKCHSKDRVLQGRTQVWWLLRPDSLHPDTEGGDCQMEPELPGPWEGNNSNIWPLLDCVSHWAGSQLWPQPLAGGRLQSLPPGLWAAHRCGQLEGTPKGMRALRDLRTRG